jgi:hypothetical protein
MPLLDVADEGIVGPAVPQAGHHVEELARALVALAMLHVLVMPKFSAASGLEVVTSSSPRARREMWSSDANLRATW